MQEPSTDNEGSSRRLQPPPPPSNDPSERSSPTLHPADPWAQKYLLTLDGGGIRGYSTLLTIKELMRVISIVEVERDSTADSSYHPIPFIPNKGSQVPEDGLSQYSVRYLPVHYFDYIAGTSTGGLIAIMLSRLRMNVDDCLLEYRTLGEEIFGKSRKFSIRGPFFWPRERYNHEKLEAVIKNVIKRRAVVEHGEMAEHMFKADEKRCRTIVFSVNKDSKDDRGVYIFRTYQHLPAGDGNEIELNPGPAHNIPTWKVARATSAAPTYFEPMKIGTTTHLDGGFGNANNPAMFAWWEVSQMSGDIETPIALTISVGTGMSQPVSPFGDRGFLGKWRAYLKFAAHIASDSQYTHRMMIAHHRVPSRQGRYHRFNVDEGLEDVKLGEWKTRQLYPGTEYITLDRIERATYTYLRKPTVQQSLRRFAEILVDNRRARSRDPRWNTIATGEQYHCTENACIARNICHTSMDDLRRHLKSPSHNYPDETEEERRHLDELIQRGKILPSE